MLENRLNPVDTQSVKASEFPEFGRISESYPIFVAITFGMNQGRSTARCDRRSTPCQ